MPDVYPIEVTTAEIIGSSHRRDRLISVKRYDFKRPDKFSLEQIRTVQIVHETVARHLTVALTGLIGTATEVAVSAIDQLTYEEFIRSVPGTTAFVLLSMKPLRGPAVLEIDPAVARVLVDSACGSRDARLSADAANAGFTPLEALMITDIANGFLPALEQGWQNVIGLTPRVTSVETTWRDVMIVPPTEMIVLASLVVRIAGEQAFMNIAIPYLTIEPIIERLSAQYWYSSVRKRRGDDPVHEFAYDLPVDCELTIPVAGLRLADLPKILTGVSVPLSLLADGEIIAQAGGVDVARLEASHASLFDDRLELPILEAHRLTTGGGSDAAAAESARILGVVESLREEIRSVRIAVEEARDDRETMLEPQADESIVRRTDVTYPREVAALVSKERPIVVAFVLSALAPEQAAVILASLPDSLRDETVRSLVRLGSADARLHARVLSHLTKSVQTNRDSNVAGGAAVAAGILNHVPRSVERAIMGRFESEDASTFESIAQLMFVFEDFVLVDAAAIRKVADRVTPEELALAIKGVPREVVSHILGALDAGQVAAIKAAESEFGRVRRSDVDAAQHDVIEELRQLEMAGEVVIARPDEVVE